MTEYEEKFVAKGNPICMLQIFYRKINNNIPCLYHKIKQGWNYEF